VADGYYDENGNFIPGSFADQLDLPGPGGVDQAALTAAQQTVAQQKFTAAKAMSTYSKNKGAAASAMAAYRKKGATKAQKAAATKARNAALARMKSATTTRNAALTAQNTAQNKVYEVSGQYEKLLTGANRDAYAALTGLFNQYGLGSLAPKIYEFAKQGYGADVITLLLQDTKEYKERFAANATRAKNGLPVLSPAEYLSTEASYRQILSSAGLPKGFYDNPADFANWIGGDVSPTEIKSRVDIAIGNTMQAAPGVKEALQQLYGVDESHLIAWALDEKKALPIIQKQAQAAQFGAEAIKRGLALNGQNLEDFVTSGLSLSQVSQGFQTVAEALPNIQAIAARYGETFGQSELEQDIIGGVAQSGLGETKRKRLASQERGLFAGSAGATPAGLSTGFQAV
jgi:hypothetical protein